MSKLSRFILKKPLRTSGIVLLAGLFIIIILYAAGIRPQAVNRLFGSEVVQGTASAGPVGGEVDLRGYADKMVALCAGISYHPTCYDKEIPKLMQALTMEQVFGVTAIVQDLDHTYTYCHVLGHELAAAEVAKDPSKWKDVITRSPRGLCSNGAIHGAFQERFRRESLDDKEIVELKPELQDVCEPRGTWKPTGLEQGSCYHALGHLVMYITAGEIQKAVSLCGDLALKNNGQASIY
jgi:hypothetical protein